ncbi:hypothetical protein Q8W14_13210 [Photobacterium damselae subsp. piscicida]|nr:hypothetical protein [Photobacterium damselae subsp. piscicida]
MVAAIKLTAMVRKAINPIAAMRRLPIVLFERLTLIFIPLAEIIPFDLLRSILANCCAWYHAIESVFFELEYPACLMINKQNSLCLRLVLILAVLTQAVSLFDSFFVGIALTDVDIYRYYAIIATLGLDWLIEN